MDDPIVQNTQLPHHTTGEDPLTWFERVVDAVERSMPPEVVARCNNEKEVRALARQVARAACVQLARAHAECN